MRKGQLGTRSAWEEVNEGDQALLSGKSRGWGWEREEGQGHGKKFLLARESN